MKVKVNKEDYYKIKCEEWFNDRGFIVYGMFATDKEYIPITFEGIYTKTRTKIMYIDSWEELYERKREALHCILTSFYTEKSKDIKTLNKGKFYNNRFPDCWEEEYINKIDELIAAVNELKNK